MEAAPLFDEPRPQPRLSADERVLLHMPVDVRSAALAVIAVICCIAMLHWAKDVFIPVLLGVVFSYALSPVVDSMVRLGLRRALSAVVLMTAVFGSVGVAAWSLNDDAAALIDSLPEAAQKMRRSLASWHPKGQGTLEKMQKVASQLQRVAAENVPVSPASKGVTHVQVEQPMFAIGDYLWAGTLGLVKIGGQAVAVCLITFFLLLSGKSFRRKLVKITGPTFREKRITVKVLETITDQIKRYLLVQLATSTFSGVAVGLSFIAMGVQHAAVWAVVAWALNFIPYLGAITFIASATLVSLWQFGTPDMALTVSAVSLAIFTVEGSLLTPWLSSRASRMSPVVIFVGVLAWGWLWGVWGLFLGVPALMIIKSVCDHVDGLQPIGELMSADGEQD